MVIHYCELLVFVLVLEYAKAHRTVPEDRAKVVLKDLGNLEKERVAARKSCLRKVAKVLPATKTMRFAQVESQLNLAIRLELPPESLSFHWLNDRSPVLTA